VIVAAGMVIGLPAGLNTLALQSALYEAAPPEAIGAAGGLFQTCRYVGAILSGVVIGIVFAAGISTPGLHVLAVLLAVLSAGLLVAAVAVAARAHAGTVSSSSW
jgi:sugar phosphate permease